MGFLASRFVTVYFCSKKSKKKSRKSHKICGQFAVWQALYSGFTVKNESKVSKRASKFISCCSISLNCHESFKSCLVLSLLLRLVSVFLKLKICQKCFGGRGSLQTPLGELAYIQRSPRPS